MKTVITWARMVALFLIAACTTSGPSKLDIEADRARWTAIRDTAADGTIDPDESAKIGELLIAWDAKLAADEAAGARPPASQFDEILRVYGEAAVSVFLTDEVARAQKRYPEAFALIDRDRDGAITIDELRAIDPASPVFAMVVVSTAHRLLKRR